MSTADLPIHPVTTREQRDPAGVFVTETVYPGMTYRQWLVGMALSGIVANHKTLEVLGLMLKVGEVKNGLDPIASMAVNLADAAVRAQEG